MRNLKSILIIAFLSLTVTSCNESEETMLTPVTANKVENFAAPQIGNTGRGAVSGEFSKFSFKTGTQVTDDNWDIAFRGLTILVNGGGKVGIADEPERTGEAGLLLVNDTFSNVIDVPENAIFKQDATDSYALPIGSNNGWYSYDFINNVINPIAGVILIIKTNDGHYAKMEILNYYKNNDSSNPENGRHYTFNYIYNPNVGETSFE
ncbi:HmuY family protein [uncultured Polaribacter sp.]|uniref:HmuY family protein n=1 Tax=uncultured Polaribacter sp. TaxID=174711 RepID=UPI00261D8CB2|nr:HmuY family protein [uncultured Polaribacter sp.]